MKVFLCFHNQQIIIQRLCYYYYHYYYLYYLYSGTGRLKSILCLAKQMPRKSFFRASFEELYSLRLCLIISTLIYSHSDSRVPTYRGRAHFIGALEDEKLRWTDLFRHVTQNSYKNVSPLCGVELPNFCLHD
jgi:hypothetical protein